MLDQFNQLKKEFNDNKYPSFKQRRLKLLNLKKSILKHRSAIHNAITQDFNQRDKSETDTIELLPVIQSIDYSLQHLKKWMTPERRKTSWLYLPGKNKIQYQPLGVIGIISPWNYPVFLSLGPLIAALSAGNKAMLKLSEFTPHTNRILKIIIAESIKNEAIIIEGETNIAAQFSELPFAHLLYTGSTSVGKLVMQAASKNLTPVTLELGGKSPLIIADDININDVCDKIIFGKMINSGQTCVGIDYLLIPFDKKQACIDGLQNSFKHFFNHKIQYTSIINQRHYERLNNYIEQAKNMGATVINCQSEVLQNKNLVELRQMPLSLILDAPLESRVWQDEIFGPILPIYTYQHISEAVDFVNDRAHPLSLYLFSHNKNLQKNIIEQTHSGSVCINETLLQVVQDDLPFGGIGHSGMGSYHAKEGFKTFSHAKSIHYKGAINSTILSYPKYRLKIFNKILKLLFR